MRTKLYWVSSVILGLMLSLVAEPIHAYVFVMVFEFLSFNYFYFAWAVSSLVPAFLIVFPAGFFIFESKPFLYGGLTGSIGVIGLVGFHVSYKIPLSNGFVIEYISLIFFSCIAAHWGRGLSIKLRK